MRVASRLTLIAIAMLAALSVSSAFAGVTAQWWPMAGNDAGRTYATDLWRGPSAPTIEWGVSLGTATYTSPVIGPDGTVYVGGSDGKLYAIGGDGKQKWQFDTGAPIYSAPAIDETHSVFVDMRTVIYVVSGGYLTAVNSDGTQKWRTADATGSPTTDESRSIRTIDESSTVYVETGDGRLAAIDADGNEKWRFPVPGGVSTPPAVDASGTVYVGGRDSYVYAIDPDGTQKWRSLTWQDPPEAVEIPRREHRMRVAVVRRTPPLFESTIYVRRPGLVFAFNADGTTKWVSLSPGTGEMLEPAYTAFAVSSNLGLYLAAENRLFMEFTGDSGNGWVRYTDAPIVTSPVVDVDGTAYVGTSDRILRAIDVAKRQRWELELSAPLAAPVAIDNAVMYAVTTDGKLYAIRQATGISIGSDLYSVRIGQKATLAGALGDPGTVGQLVNVDVHKPNRSYWSYSSNRRVYSSGGRALWQYKYTFIRGMTKGTYRFRAVYPTLISRTIAIKLR